MITPIIGEKYKKNFPPPADVIVEMLRFLPKIFGISHFCTFGAKKIDK
jgi:hypothetical protein